MIIPPLSTLRTFEAVILDGRPHTVAEIQKQWGIVELHWKELLSNTYTVPGYLPYTEVDYLIAREGWQDFFNKFGINPDRVEYVYELQSIFQSLSMPYKIIHSPWRYSIQAAPGWDFLKFNAAMSLI
jgi:hypothetical protein